MLYASTGSNMNNLQKTSSDTSKKSPRTLDIVNRGLKKRYKAERRFRLYGILAIAGSLLFLTLLFASIIGKGYTAFQQTFVELDVFFRQGHFTPGRFGNCQLSRSG